MVLLFMLFFVEVSSQHPATVLAARSLALVVAFRAFRCAPKFKIRSLLMSLLLMIVVAFILDEAKRCWAVQCYPILAPMFFLKFTKKQHRYVNFYLSGK